MAAQLRMSWWYVYLSLLILESVQLLTVYIPGRTRPHLACFREAMAQVPDGLRVHHDDGTRRHRHSELRPPQHRRARTPRRDGLSQCRLELTVGSSQAMP